ncbi:hypothetical protein [Kineococcus rhizosphaerae]|uniref:Uncharacterized protein n=1 Tax=Kineococcus rhizosphaerae TaxID=559628 RepID=A0A2T0QZV9_9ACTN|nr:hypothetical protein [Kineococcus rhizosphaerae]PRY12226.1 hypothetical protein CLV37_111183 [Kineococcus rhizosphaerae]
MNQDLQRLLSDAVPTPPRRLDPDAVLHAARRRQHARRRTAAIATTGLVAACTAAALVATGSGGGGAVRVRPVTPATTVEPAPEEQWQPPGIEATDRGVNGVQVTAQGYEVRTGSAQAACVAPGAITVVGASTASLGPDCDLAQDGPGALVVPWAVRQWTGGSGTTSGLDLIDGVPVYLDDIVHGNDSSATVSVPSRGVRVQLAGDEAQVHDLLDSLTIQPRSGERQAPARASTNPVAGATITDTTNAWTGQTHDPGLLARLQEAVDDAAHVDGQPDCLPEPGQQAQIDLLTTPDYEHNPDSTPTERYLREYTYLLVDVTGRCDLVFSSTGAVLRPDPATFGPLVKQLRDSQDFDDGS